MLFRSENANETPVVPVIMDGKIIKENLEKSGINKDLLIEKLKNSGFSQEEVFYAEINQKGEISVDAYDEFLGSKIPDFEQV